MRSARIRLFVGPLPAHQCEDSPAEVLTLVSRVAGGLGGEFGADLGGQLVVRIVVEPAAEVEPLRRLIPADVGSSTPST